VLPDLESEVAAALESHELIAVTEHKRDQSDILEELLLRVRNIQRNLEDKSSPEPAMGFTGLSVREVLDRAFGKLSPSQTSILREFITPAGTARSVNIDELEAKYPKADIDALLGLAFVRRNDKEMIVVHDLIAKYIAENLRA